MLVCFVLSLVELDICTRFNFLPLYYYLITYLLWYNIKNVLLTASLLLSLPLFIYLFIVFDPSCYRFDVLPHTTTATALTAFVPLHVTTTLSVPTRYKNSLLSFILLLALLGPLFYSYHFIHDPMPWLSSILVVDVTS